MPLLSDYGATADARMVDDAAMTADSAVLSSTSAEFTASDVGRLVVIAGAGPSGGGLMTTILSHESAAEVTLAAAAETTVAAVGAAWGTDCSAAFNAALTVLDVALGGELIIDGGFLLTQPVSLLTTQTASSAIRIRGTGSDSFLLVGVDGTADALSITGVTCDLEDITFLGIPLILADAGRVLVLNGCTARLSRCRFIGIAAANQVISSTSGWLRTKDCEFGGAFTLADGLDPNITRAVIYNQDWYSYDDDSSQFIDYGHWRGLTLSKSAAATTTAWVALRTPNIAFTTSAARVAGVASFRHSRMDEGSLKGIWAEPETGVIHSLEAVGTRQNVSSADGAAAIYARKVKNVRVDRSVFGLSLDNPTYFGDFRDCDVVEINQVTLLQSVNKIRATNVGALVVRDTVIPDYELAKTNFFPVDSRYGAFALRKAGEISDADFPAPPGPGTQAIDTKNGRIYVRGGGGWFYSAFGGGDLLGPELVVNGTFAGGTTTGWTPSANASLSVVGGALRVTNTLTYGYAYQVIPVELGKTYRLSITIVGGNGNPTIWAGQNTGGPNTFVNSTASGVWTFVATTATVVIWFNLNTETVGRYGDFDNVSLRQV